MRAAWWVANLAVLWVEMRAVYLAANSADPLVAQKVDWRAEMRAGSTAVR